MKQLKQEPERNESRMDARERRSGKEDRIWEQEILLQAAIDEKQEKLMGE